MSEEAINNPVDNPQDAPAPVDNPAPVERPEWHLEKYKTIEDQAKAYPELQKKFGGFSGAPESYEINIPAEMKELGFDLDANDAMVAELNELAKTSNMNQATYDAVIGLYGKVQLAQQQWADEHKAAEIKALGENGKSRIDAIVKWGQANLDGELFEGLQDAVVSAGAVRAIEALIAKSRGTPQVGKDAPPSSAISKTDWEAKRFATNANGQRLYNIDASYRKEVDQMRDQLFGTEEHRQIIN